MSSSKELADYLYTRFPVSRFIPLAGFLTLAGLAYSPPMRLSPWLIATVQALALVLLFRLWDDVVDLEHDRRIHPERVLCNSQNLKPFLLLASILFMLNGMVLIWIHGSYMRPIVYLLLCICLLSWYRFRPAKSSKGLLNSYLVLVKYPVIAWLISSPVSDLDLEVFISCLLSVYLIFIVFEIFDDHQLNQLPLSRVGLAINFFVLLSVLIFIALWTKSYASPTYAAIWTIVLISTLVLGIMGWSQLKKSSKPRFGHGIFIIGLLTFLAIAAEKSL